MNTTCFYVVPAAVLQTVQLMRRDDDDAAAAVAGDVAAEPGRLAVAAQMRIDFLP